MIILAKIRERIIVLMARKYLQIVWNFDNKIKHVIDKKCNQGGSK